ncbi:Crp/Fnr family transcriptional regulator [Nonomuraea sp. SBT364]|uniref:Crp/Fnr family transcriptional regulator n=1 Tax=Nonomuraea sp. SBT364 TaxID=1580530 RepID=UPI00066AF77E|nr:Crp/Fnr family transcriptional regulator [Nonomuraea sp. SBT364]
MNDEAEIPGWWIGFWDYLDDAERQALLDLGRKRTFAADTTLLHEEEPSNHVLIVMSGWVKVTCQDSEGREVVLALRGPGDIIGEMEVMLEDSGRSASVRSLLNNSVDALVLPPSRFISFLGHYPNAWLALYKVLAYRLRQSNRNAREFGRIGVRQALARLLLELAVRHGTKNADGSVTVQVLSQEEIAAFIWSSRDAVARELVQFRERGLLSTGRRSYTINDMGSLRKIAKSGGY